MGYFFRGKTSSASADAEDVATTTGAAIEFGGEEIHPEADLKKFKRLHKWDPFLDVDKLDVVDSALATGDLEKEAAVEATLLVEDSPYAEVRNAVSTRSCA